MTRLLLYLFFIGIPFSALGETVEIRAGEHPEFTRLVIDKKENSSWSLARNESGYILMLEGATGFNTNPVFDRIPRARIRGLAAENGSNELQILVECDCHSNAFLWRGDKLVVDIKDGPPPENSAFELAIDGQQPSIQLPIVTPLTDPFVTATLPTFTPQNEAPIQRDQSQLTDLEKIIAESLARGAAQGLLEPSQKLVVVEPFSFGVAGTHVTSHFEQNQPGILAHTSMDIGTADTNRQDANQDDCFPASYFEISEWAKGENFAEDLTNARSEITGEFDAVDSTAASRLAKVYLFYGFGREAIAAMSVDLEMSQERLILAEIGALLDDMPSESQIFAGQIKCETNGAFWAFLSSRPAKVSLSERGTILRGFRALPESLQVYLSPRLSEQFTYSNDFEAAEMVLSIGQVENVMSTEFEMAQVAMQTEMGNLETATSALSNIVETDPRLTPETLTEYLNLALETGADIDPEKLALADILRFENNGVESVAPLAEAQVRALLSIKDVNKAFDVLDSERLVLGQQVFETLQELTILTATDEFSDTQFLELAFSERPMLTTAKAQNAVAKRLLVTGLAERAALLVSSSARGNDMQERRYLRADAAIELNSGLSALAALEGMTTERAILLRQKAELLAQDEFATTLVGDDWRLGNWAALAQGSDDLLRTVSMSILAQSIPQSDEKPTLAGGRDLVAQSADSRDLIDQVLNRFAPIE